MSFHTRPAPYDKKHPFAWMKNGRCGKDMGRFFLMLCTHLLCLVLVAVVLLTTLVLTVSWGMKDTMSPYILTEEAYQKEAERLPFDCILVLGAGLRQDGSPSPMLYDRVKVSSSLYALTGGTTPIVMSGDHTGQYNEVAAMKQTAISFLVASEDIFLDHKGYSTFESILRVKQIFSAHRILIVTQEYHLYRAIYIAREMGLDAYGVSAHLRPYGGQLKYDLREMLARYKDMFFVASKEHREIILTDATVDLSGDGNLT